MIMIVKVLIAVPPTVSVTLTVKPNVPAAVGVPEIMPVDESSDRPAGREPADTDQV